MQISAAPIGPFRCPVCGARATASGFTDNVRESGPTDCCGAWTRLRALAVVASRAAAEMTGATVSDLAGVARLPGYLVYNTEASSAVHGRLASGVNYIASEYFEGGHSSGTLVGGVLHEDLQELSFPSGSVDLVLSTDVLEHVPDPYRAHAEVLRVLRPGGRHVFTVPYAPSADDDHVRAVLDEDGNVVHLAEPQYHGDPLRPEGVLVFTIFGQAMLTRLTQLGYEVRVHHVEGDDGGFPGPAQIVFEAIRPACDPVVPPAAPPVDTAVVAVVRHVDDLVRALDRIATEHEEAAVVVVDIGARDATPSLVASLEGDVIVVRLPHGASVDDAVTAGRAVAAHRSPDVVVLAPRVRARRLPPPAHEDRPSTVGLLTVAHWHDSLGDIATAEATAQELGRRGVAVHQVTSVAGAERLVIGGGDLLYGGEQEPWRSLLAPFLTSGPHVLNAVGVAPESITTIDWGFAREHLLVAVRDDETADALSGVIEGVLAVPCPATLVDPVPWELVSTLPGHPELADLRQGEYVVVHRHPAVEPLVADIDLPVVAIDMQAWAKHPWSLPAAEVRTHSPSLAMTLVENAAAVVAHSLHLAIFALGRATPFSVVDTGDRQSDKVRRYLRRAGIVDAMSDRRSGLVDVALDLEDEIRVASAAERVAAAAHLDRVAEVLSLQPAR